MTSGREEYWNEFDPLPGEHLFSVIIRYYIRNGYSSFSEMFRSLYGDHGKLNPHCNGGRTLSGLLDIIGYTEFDEQYEFVCKTTLMELYQQQRICRSNNIHDSFINKIFYYRSIGCYDPYMNFAFQFCEKCAIEDIELCGVSYWHRIHMDSLLNICPMHGCRLFKFNTNKRYKFLDMCFLYLPSDYISRKGAYHNMIYQEEIADYKCMEAYSKYIYLVLQNADDNEIRKMYKRYMALKKD